LSDLAAMGATPLYYICWLDWIHPLHIGIFFLWVICYI
jgi:hypothetical protein